MKGVAFMDSTDKYLGFVPSNASGAASLVFDGAWDVSGSAWSFSGGSVAVNAIVASGLYGSGTVTPKSQFSGGYAVPTPSSPLTPLSMDYSSANALAVAPGDTTGTWTTTELTVSIDSSGLLAGALSGPTYGHCALSGTIAPKEPATAKNLYAMNIALAHSSPGSCSLETALGQYQGYGAITFTNVGAAGAPLFARSFTLLVRTSNHVWFAAELVKQ